MELYSEKIEKNKEEGIIKNLINLKNQYINSLEKFEFPKNEILIELDSYINIIKNICIDLNIDNIQIYFNSLQHLSNILNNNLPNLLEDKNFFYLKHEEFIISIHDKIKTLNDIRNEILKSKSRIFNLMDKNSKNNEDQLLMNLKNSNSIEEYINNPLIDKYVNEDIINSIKNCNEIQSKYMKIYEKNKNDFNELYIINKELINQIKKSNIIYKDMKNKFMCNKFMKNTNNNILKIHNNIYNCYIKAFYDYFMKLSRIVIKKISEKNLKLSGININEEEISNEPQIKDNINENYNNAIKDKKNQNDYLNIILNDGSNNIIGEMENVSKNNYNLHVINLDDEFEENPINHTNNKIDNFHGNNNKIVLNGERIMNYKNLFNIKEKLSESNKDNAEIIFNLKNLEKNFALGKKEQENKEYLLNEKYKQIIKYNRDELNNEKKFLENEHNNLKLKEKEYKLKYDDLESKYRTNPIGIESSKIKKEDIKKNENIINNINQNDKNENIIINNIKINEKEKKINIDNIDIKQKLNLEINKKENNKNIIESKNNINDNKKLDKIKKVDFFKDDMLLKKDDGKNDVKLEKKNKENLDSKNIITNNPFSFAKEKENEDDAILKQIRALDNLPSVLSNRKSSSKIKKESPSPTIIQRTHNDNNLTLQFSGLNINNTFVSNIEDVKKDSDKKKEKKISNINSETNIFNINQNTSNNINNTGKQNLFDFNTKSSNSNPFNMSEINNSIPNRPFNSQIDNNNKNIFNLFSQGQNNIKKEENSIFKNFNSTNNQIQNNIFTSKLTFGMHNTTLNSQGNNIGNNNNSNLNLNNFSFGNNNFNGINNNNSQSPFVSLNTNQGFNNFRNDGQETNDENYF